MSVDDICMAFQLSEDTVREISEDMKGWPMLIAALSEYLDGVMHPDEWFAKVVKPPFAPCTTLIFDASAGPGSVD